MNVISCDLVKLASKGNFDCIIHGCNCFNTMGLGVAKSIRFAFPEAYTVDQKTKKGSREKLGKISYAALVKKWTCNSCCECIYSI